MRNLVQKTQIFFEFLPSL